MGCDKCHSDKSKVPRIQAFNKFNDGQVISGDHRTEDVTYVNFDTFTERKCINYEQDPETGTVFTIKKDGTYQINYGGIFILGVNIEPPQELPSPIPFTFGATILVNALTPPVSGPQNGEIFYSSLNTVIDGILPVGTTVVTQNRSYLLKLKHGDKLRYIAGGASGELYNVLLLNANLSLERLP